MNIKLNLENSLELTTGGILCVKNSSSSNNTLSIRTSGLYAPAPKGDPGTAGTGFPDGYRSDNGLLSGVVGPDDSTSKPKRIVGPSIVHRVFEATSIDGGGIVLKDGDYMYPGDMYRVKDNNPSHLSYNYYIILSVDKTGKQVATHTGEVAVIPFSKTDVN